VSADAPEHEPGRPAWAALRAELAASGFRPARRLGQNFLLDENLLRAIVRDAGVGPGDRVLEVGPGLGFLTRHLLAAGAEVLAVEIDARLLERARAALGEQPRLAWIHSDVLDGKHALAAAVRARLPAQGAWHLVANLPYSVSGPTLALCAALENPPATMTALVQRELGERVCAAPGTADWGPLSIRLQLGYDARLVRTVPAAAFWPRPQVESALVRLERRAAQPDPSLVRALSGLVERLFQRRRQQIARVLAEHAGSRERALDWLSRAGIEPGARAEDLDLAQLLALARNATPDA
jgi:16S rRNA (adenine1518-N6/adenine1519-N6)-dimethyltransferase